MKYLINILCILDMILAIISIPPCLMAGLMGLSDSPEPKSFWLILFACFVLAFPIISLICGTAPRSLNSYLSLAVASFPIIVVVLLFSLMEYLK
jgi:hypothetical protein